MVWSARSATRVGHSRTACAAWWVKPPSAISSILSDGCHGPAIEVLIGTRTRAVSDTVRNVVPSFIIDIIGFWCFFYAIGLWPHKEVAQNGVAFPGSSWPRVSHRNLSCEFLRTTGIVRAFYQSNGTEPWVLGPGGISRECGNQQRSNKNIGMRSAKTGREPRNDDRYHRLSIGP